MSKSNAQGRAYEFAYLMAFEDIVNQYRKITIIKNSGYYAARSAWETIDDVMRENNLKSASAGVLTIIESEPLIIENNNDTLEVCIQKDKEGEDGDVRDILLVCRKIQWEIGISTKHNHFAVKHSRLSHRLDFGNKWFGVSCSENYWNDIKPIFDYLKQQKTDGKKWSELPAKEDGIYIPLLNAFLKEIDRSYKIHKDALARSMVEYLLGKFDFYKAIGLHRKRITQLQPYNLRGMLNKSSKTHKPKLIIPVSKLPTRIVHTELKPGSSNTAEIYMDEGWHFSFRIHNASTLVEPSLKFDIQIIGMPTSIICIDCKWD